VIASARREKEVVAFVTEIRVEGLEATPVVGDVDVERDVIDLVAKTIATYGRIDVALNNAGTEGAFTPFLEQSNEIYDRIFNTNVRGVFWSMKHDAKAMLAQGHGVIINNASAGAIVGFANAGLYVASKHAVVGMTKTVAIELFKKGVRVNAICPGIIATPFQDRIWPSREVRGAFEASTPPGRMGTSEEMATVVAFLASDDAAFVSGHALVADGGLSRKSERAAMVGFGDGS
jgi:NAD(P)-dependent dehydrogenase (short-subunit alcohol dehydrogenase family)